MIKQVLYGGENANSVIRIGDTVHRTMSSNHEFIHLVFKHLQQYNFTHAPRFYEISDSGQEVLSYLPGKVPRDKKLNDTQLRQCMKLLRTYHDVAAKSPLCNNHETICHNDFAPRNVIFDDEELVGIIDFDDCAPGSRIDDVAYFLWTFLDLGNEQISDDEQFSRIKMLLKEYGIRDSGGLTDSLIGQQSRVLLYRESKVVAETDDSRKADLNMRVE